MSDRPLWWNADIEKACRVAAMEGLPNEVCGIISSREGTMNLHMFESRSTPYLVDATPESVVSLAYELEREGRHIIATFHSHPLGQRHFSRRDEMLTLWANEHVFAVWNHDSWDFLYKHAAHVQE